MKNTEIRIGNYVYRNDILVTVDEQTFWDMKNNPEQYKPVRLTENWLEKLGFQKDMDGSFVYGLIALFKDKRLKQNVYLYTDAINSFHEGQWVVINDLKVEYIHQLQNLYFALTNQELKA